MQGDNDIVPSQDWSNRQLPGNSNIQVRKAAVYATGKTVGDIILTSDDIIFEVEFYSDLERADVGVTWDIKNVQGIHVAHVGATCKENGLHRGWHKTTGVLPGNILNTDRYIFSVTFGLNQREVLFRMEDFLIFDVEDDIQTRGSNFSRFPGVIHPRCQWQTEAVH